MMVKEVNEKGVWKQVVSKEKFAKLWVERAEEHMKNCLDETCEFYWAYADFKKKFKIE